MSACLGFRELGLQPYEPVLEAMRRFTEQRSPDSQDEVWLVEHPAVFTQGQAGKAEHLLVPGDIPVVQTDRGGQVTYHGPGQLVAYLLLDVRRLGFGVRELVSRIEQTLIDLLASYDVRPRPSPTPRASMSTERRSLPRPANPQWPFVPRPCPERGHGPRAIPPNQPLRLCGAGDDPAARPGRSDRTRRGQDKAARTAGQAPRLR